MKYYFIALLACLALVFIFGCIQQSILTTACAGVSQDRLANCIYVNAVEDQNPYYCYEMPANRPDVRKACITDASDDSMKTALDNMVQSQRDQLFMENTSANANPAMPSMPPEATNSTAPENISNTTVALNITANMTDNETYAAAVASLQITACQNIADPSLHNSCISEVAQKTKNISACAALTLPADQDLCNAYSRG